MDRARRFYRRGWRFDPSRVHRESWYFSASAGNGGREVSPSSAIVRWIAQRGEGSGEKRQLVYGCTKSPLWEANEGRSRRRNPAYLQVPGYSDKKLPEWGVFCWQVIYRPTLPFLAPLPQEAHRGVSCPASF